MRLVIHGCSFVPLYSCCVCPPDWQGLNERKNLPPDTILTTLSNLSTFLSCVSLESSVPMWTNILTQFDIFFRRLPTVLPSPCNTEPILTIIATLLKVYVITNVRVSSRFCCAFFLRSAIGGVAYVTVFF